MRAVFLNLRLRKRANLKNTKPTYWNNITTTIRTLSQGLKTTARHIGKSTHSRKPVGIAESDYFELEDGLSTLQYPHETFSIPDNGRYRLHNEMDDCIVCDKCVKICPVDCIEIDAIKAIEEIGKTSDGTTKRIHGARFDIDMSKCCFCGLCTTVCPTESLTMTKSYDFSEFDVRDHKYAYATMSPLEILEKEKALEEYNQKREEQKAVQVKNTAVKSKPMFKPRVQPKRPDSQK